MDGVDRKILNLIQKEFPVTAEPFKEIGASVGVSEDEALERVRRLREEGIIRRIGAVFDPGKLGFVSALCAARVPEEKIRSFVETVNVLPGVTHNYRRNHEYNVWFTVIAPSEESLEESLAGIKENSGVVDILTMRAVRTFKVDASFEL
ncbi:MAG TPA: AsnC family transcriptional regulator [Syntrophales bacterium]|nr:AsnC family transcriptional regulator [Syntrophales bacterium]HRT70599.1 AsnC family transcriptional regulator [Syntrophales bacterium]